MLPDDFLLMVNSILLAEILAVYYLSSATYFCIKRLKIAISEDIVMQKRPFIRPRLLFLVPIKSTCTHSY